MAFLLPILGRAATFALPALARVASPLLRGIG